MWIFVRQLQCNQELRYPGVERLCWPGVDRAVLVRVDREVELASCDLCQVTGVELSAAPRRPQDFQRCNRFPALTLSSRALWFLTAPGRSRERHCI